MTRYCDDDYNDFDDDESGPGICPECGEECTFTLQDIGFAHDWHGVHQPGCDWQYVSDCCGAPREH
jgi:hypothetical protein